MIIALTGGIGCGKSVVSELLRVMGYIVYDCDANAKLLMHSDSELRNGLTTLFGPETYNADGTLNKQHLSAAIFGNAEALNKMNNLVHPAVARDITKLYREMNAKVGDKNVLLFFESAILFESHFDELVKPDIVVSVSAPFEMRLARATTRDHASRQQIIRRIENQMSQEKKDERADIVIYNDEKNSIILQIDKLLSSILQ